MYLSFKSGAIILSTINNQFQIIMKSIVLLGIVLGTLSLTSCTTYRTVEVIPYKAFQYSYKDPSRVLVEPHFAKQLSSAKPGMVVNLYKPKGTASLGHSYYSANGNNCRRYTVNASMEYAACKINGQWYQVSSIISSKQN